MPLAIARCRLEIGRIELVHGDRLGGEPARLGQKLPLGLVEHALGHGLGKLLLRIEGANLAALERLLKLALYRLGGDHVGEHGVDPPAGVVLARGEESAGDQPVAGLRGAEQQVGDALNEAIGRRTQAAAEGEDQHAKQPRQRPRPEVHEKPIERLPHAMEAAGKGELHEGPVGCRITLVVVALEHSRGDIELA